MKKKQEIEVGKKRLHECERGKKRAREQRRVHMISVECLLTLIRGPGP